MWDDRSTTLRLLERVWDGWDAGGVEAVWEISEALRRRTQAASPYEKIPAIAYRSGKVKRWYGRCGGRSGRWRFKSAAQQWRSPEPSSGPMAPQPSLPVLVLVFQQDRKDARPGRGDVRARAPCAPTACDRRRWLGILVRASASTQSPPAVSSPTKW